MAIAAIGLWWCPSGAQDTGPLVVNPDEFIEWSAERPLNWRDYRFRRFRHNRGDMAITSVKHSIRGRLKDGKPEFEVKVLFVVKDSWTSDSTDVALLAHERLHFDIGELFGRKIRKRIASLYRESEEDLSVYRRWIRLFLDDFKRFSYRYDQETSFGTDADQQLIWKRKVDEELNRLHTYQ